MNARLNRVLVMNATIAGPLGNSATSDSVYAASVDYGSAGGRVGADRMGYWVQTVTRRAQLARSIRARTASAAARCAQRRFPTRSGRPAFRSPIWRTSVARTCIQAAGLSEWMSRGSATSR